MNAYMNDTVPPLRARLPRVRRLWVKNGVLVNGQNAVIVPLKANVFWEAYVVNNDNMQTLEEYPRLTDSGVYVVTDNRPTADIIADYLKKIQEKVDNAAYQKLTTQLQEEAWSVATIIHSTKPVDV